MSKEKVVETVTEEPEIEIIEEIDVYPADKGKILKEIIEPVDGELMPNAASVKIHYTGSLSDGTKFDSSKDRYGPLEFTLGEGKVIRGLEIGVNSMKKGEQAILTIAPEYAYGPEGIPPFIPPNETLEYDVELLEWNVDDLSPEKDGSVIRTNRIEKGVGYSFPTKGSIVEVHLIGKYDDKSIEDRKVIFKLGEGQSDKVIKGVEIAVEKFKSGEKSTVTIQSKFAFDDPNFEQCGVPSGQTVEYTIKLRQFERSKNSWSLDENERIQLSEMFKEKGNQLFKLKNYLAAINVYKKILDFLIEKDREIIKIKVEDSSKLVLSANLNLALSFLKIEEFEMSYKMAKDALKIAPDNDKAHYRCGQALLGLSDIEKSLAHFEKCIEINPKNKEAKSQYAKILQISKDRAEKEKKLYVSMFEKILETASQDS